MSRLRACENFRGVRHPEQLRWSAITRTDGPRTVMLRRQSDVGSDTPRQGLRTVGRCDLRVLAGPPSFRHGGRLPGQRDRAGASCRQGPGVIAGS